MTASVEEQTRGVIRVQFGRHRRVLAWADVDFSRTSTDPQVLLAVAAALGVPAAEVAGAAVVRHVNGNLTVRPPVAHG